MLVWVMLNPSTADHTNNDPTINKIMKYARDWGYGAIVVVNLYAVRSTDQTLIQGRVGPHNDRWLSVMFDHARRRDLKVIAAWGRNHSARASEVRALAKRVGVKLYALGVSQNGEPKHPLYLPSDALPKRYRA